MTRPGAGDEMRLASQPLSMALVNPLLILVVTMMLSTPVSANGEKLVATNSDVRMVLGFAAPAGAVAALLPQGWECDVASSGPAKDINLRVTFIDTRVTRNARGKALTPHRIAHLSLPARKAACLAGATMLVVVYSTGGNGGPYGNSVQASASVARRTETSPTAGTVVQEHWQFHTEHGHAIDAQIEYMPGAPTVLEVEERVHAAATPDCCRIYRAEQTLEVLRDADADRTRRLRFSASGPLLSSLFDGSERLVRVDAVPWYARRVFVPPQGSADPN